jgi:hypothetical protein
VAPLIETIVAFCHFHPLVEVDFHPFVNDFDLEMDLVLDRKAFIFVLMRSPHLSFGSLLSMVYELLQYFLVPDDFASGFDFFLRYVNTSFMVMFFHHCRAYLLHCDYCLWKNKPKVFDPL